MLVELVEALLLLTLHLPSWPFPTCPHLARPVSAEGSLHWKVRQHFEWQMGLQIVGCSVSKNMSTVISLRHYLFEGGKKQQRRTAFKVTFLVLECHLWVSF